MYKILRLTLHIKLDNWQIKIDSSFLKVEPLKVGTVI